VASGFAWCETSICPPAASPARSFDDARIIEEFLRSGDDEFFKVLVQRYRDRVLRLVSSILGPSAELQAEDLVQEVFITVYRKLDTFRGDCSFSTWLYRISRNRAVDGRRRQRPMAAIEEEALQRDATANWATDPNSELDRSNRELSVLRQVDELGEPRRTVVFLHYWMGCSVEEISGFIEISAGTVKSHLFRARRELAGRLNREVLDG
jgi:RNA polymerase sigma-70 factor (ECF subfamily)